MALLLSTTVNGSLVANNLQLVGAQGSPADPNANLSPNTAVLYTKNVANAYLAHWTTTVANVTSYNPAAPFSVHKGYRGSGLVAPGVFSTTNTTCYNSQGDLSLNIKADSANSAYIPVLTAPTYKSALRKIQLGASAAVNSNAIIGSNISQFWGGNVANSGTGGGYFIVMTGSIDTLTANQNVFWGVTNATLAAQGTMLLPNSIDVCTNTQFIRLGVGANNSGNLQLITAANGNSVATDLGTNFTLSGLTDVYEFSMFVPPGVIGLGYRVRNLSNGAETQGTVSNTSLLPNSNSFLSMAMWIQNSAANGSVGNISMIRIYTEEMY